MGNANRIVIQGPCKSCNANGGKWGAEADTVHCLRPYQSSRHVIRGDAATIQTHSCWAPVTQPLKLDAVADLLQQIKVKGKMRR